MQTEEEKKAKKKAYMKEYHSRPEVKVKVRVAKIKYRKTQKGKINEKEYRSRPEIKIKLNANARKNQKTQKRKDYMKRYCKTTEFKTKKNEKKRVRYNSDKTYRIKNLLRKRLLEVMKDYTKTGKIYSSSKYGVDYRAIIEHLRPFPVDIHLYHIDHVKPLCKFLFINEDGSTNLEEVKKAFAPCNHQWLLAYDNLSKGSKYLIN